MPPAFRFLFAGLVSVMAIPLAMADADDTFNIYPAIGAQRDDNLFRRASGAESDTIETASLTLALNKALGLQRFSLDLTVIDYRYAHNDYLDYQAKNYAAAWNWSLTPRLTGVVSLDQTEVQNSFVDYAATTPQTRRNIRRTNVNHLGAEWQVSGGWRLLGGLTNNEQGNSETFNAQSSYALNTWEFGGKYVWPGGNYLQLLRREGDGEYKDREVVGFDRVPAPFNPQYDNAFRQTDSEARLYVPLSGKSVLSGRLARQSRQHEHFGQRDYAATTGRLDYTWLPTGQVSLVGGLRREVAAYQDYFSSYYLADGFNLQPAWQISARTTLRLNYDWQRRNYEGGLLAGVASRRDTLQSLRLGLEWAPLRWASLITSYQRDTRNSNQNNLDFSANIFSVNARFSF